MSDIFESIAAATKPKSVSLKDDSSKLTEMHAKLKEVADSYEFETPEGSDAHSDVKQGLVIMGKIFKIK
jgi:hypothetical protein